MIETLTLLLVLITGYYAWITSRILAANRKAVDAVFEQTRATTRPYVHFDFSHTLAPFIEGRLRNTGLTAAHDIKVSINPIIYVAHGNHYIPSHLTSKLITFLGPAGELFEDYQSMQMLLDKSGSKFDGEITYKDSSGSLYCEPFTIDLSSTATMAYLGKSTVAGELKKLNEEFRNLTRIIEKLPK